METVRVLVLSVEEVPEIVVSKDATAELVNYVVREQYGVQPNGEPHLWIVADNVQDDIAGVMLRVTRDRAKRAVAMVYLPDWGIVYKLPDGGWHHLEGGYFGPSTPMAKLCEEELAKFKKPD